MSIVLENVRRLVGSLHLADVNGVETVVVIRDGDDPIEAARAALSLARDGGLHE